MRLAGGQTFVTRPCNWLYVRNWHKRVVFKTKKFSHSVNLQAAILTAGFLQVPPRSSFKKLLLGTWLWLGVQFKGFPPIFLNIYFAGDLTFWSSKNTPNNRQTMNKERAIFWHNENRPPPIVTILWLISSSAGQSIVKSAIVTARTIHLFMQWQLLIIVFFVAAAIWTP